MKRLTEAAAEALLREDATSTTPLTHNLGLLSPMAKLRAIEFMRAAKAIINKK